MRRNREELNVLNTELWTTVAQWQLHVNHVAMKTVVNAWRMKNHSYSNCMSYSLYIHASWGCCNHCDLILWRLQFWSHFPTNHIHCWSHYVVIVFYSYVYTSIENHRKSAECLCKIATARITSHTAHLSSAVWLYLKSICCLLYSEFQQSCSCLLCSPILKGAFNGCALVKLPVTSIFVSWLFQWVWLHETLVLILSLSKCGSLLYAL